MDTWSFLFISRQIGFFIKTLKCFIIKDKNEMTIANTCVVLTICTFLCSIKRLRNMPRTEEIERQNLNPGNRAAESVVQNTMS